MSTEDQNCETPSGCVRKHITALEAANGRNRSCSPKISAEVKAEASCKVRLGIAGPRPHPNACVPSLLALTCSIGVRDRKPP